MTFLNCVMHDAPKRHVTSQDLKETTTRGSIQRKMLVSSTKNKTRKITEMHLMRCEDDEREMDWKVIQLVFSDQLALD